MTPPEDTLAQHGTAAGRDARGFLHRLRERKLVQWALAYLAGAWLVLQVFGAVSASFGWRPAVGRVLIALLVAGLFVALVLAWYHGEQGRQRVSGAELLMLAALFVIAGGVAAMAGRDRPARAATPPSASSALASPPPAAGRSLVVLPFTNLSGNRENEYFSDGVAEDILTNLSRIAGLRVISRTSAMSYRGTSKPLRQIAGELGVSHVVEGSVRRAGDRVRISVQLIDARTDAHLWAQSYDRELKDVFQVQSEIAQQIAGALQVRLTRDERERITTAPTTSLTAYDYYLQGRQYLVRFTAGDNRHAVELLERAVALDPDYALAHAWLARVSMSFLPFPYDSAAALGRRAIALDPNLSDGYAALGEIYRQTGRYSAALRQQRRAVALNPNDATATAEIGQTYGDMGRLDESIRWLERGVSLDPRTVWPYSHVCFAYALLEMQDEAEGWCRRGLELQPDFFWLHVTLAALYARRGDLAVAERYARTAVAMDSSLAVLGGIELLRGNLRAALEQFRRSPGGSEHWDPTAGFIYWKLGQRDSAESEFRRVERRSRRLLAEGNESYGPHLALAVIHATRGESAQALRDIEEAVARGWRDAWFLSTSRVFEPLRGEPRFQQILTELRAEVARQRQRVEREGL